MKYTIKEKELSGKYLFGAIKPKDTTIYYVITHVASSGMNNAARIQNYSTISFCSVAYTL